MDNEPVEKPTRRRKPVADPAPGAQDLVENAAAVDAEPAGHPTLAQGQAMFDARPDMAEILTDAGWLSRDGVLTPAAVGL